MPYVRVNETKRVKREVILWSKKATIIQKPKLTLLVFLFVSLSPGLSLDGKKNRCKSYKRNSR